MNEASTVTSKVCPACGASCPEDALFCPHDGIPVPGARAAAAGGGKDAGAEVDPYLGMELAGHIVVRELVGVGAMGRVYRAFQKGIERNVAVKILHRELSANAQLVARFTREAKVVSRLAHPNIVQVLLAGQLDDGALYIVMEYLDGQSLQSVLAAAPKGVSLSRALHIGLQLCDAVGEGHQQGVVHRDLKPENVMLVRRGSDDEFVKVLDFGIARVQWGGDPSVATAAGLIFGTARYISPEGAQGAQVVPASDVYAIATILYQLLTGRTPFDGDQAVGLLVQQIHDAPPPLRDMPHASHVPAAIADVIMANLAKDPSLRAPDAHAFGQALLAAAKRAGLSAEDLSRPILQRKVNALQLPPSDRAKSFELTPDILARMGPALAPSPSDAQLDIAVPRGLSGATTKWEPPSEFQVKLNAAAEGARTSPSAGVEPRPVVETTLDDGYAVPVPRIATQYAVPAFEDAGRGAVAEEPVVRDRASTFDVEPSDRGAISRGIVIVALCFLVGAALAGVFVWKIGKAGSGDLDRVVARATAAVNSQRFGEPPGDNVRDLTDDGLRRYPGDPRLVQLRVSAARLVVARAVQKHDAGDRAGAIKDLSLAVDLDPNEPTAPLWMDRYRGELASLDGTSLLAAPQMLVPASEPSPDPARDDEPRSRTAPPKPRHAPSRKVAPAPAVHRAADADAKSPATDDARPSSDASPAPAPSIKWM